MSNRSTYEDKYDFILNKLESLDKHAELDPTLFDISGYPHYENVISNWYAFFLDERNAHGLGDLFYSSLRQLLNESNYKISSCEVEREYYTKKRCRIDLLLHEGKDNGYFNRPIIIENKIYHVLDNDLDDYYDSIPTKNDDKPRGVILRLDKVSCDNKRFKVITHAEYMDVIKGNFHKYMLDVKPKYFNLLQDFICNIESMGSVKSMNEAEKYYFKNHEKIDDLFIVRKSAYKNVIDNAYKNINGSKKYKWGKSVAVNGSYDFSEMSSGTGFYINLLGLYFVVDVWMNDKLYSLYEKHTDFQKETLDEKLRLSISGEIMDTKDKKILVSVKYKVDEGDIDEYHNMIIKVISTELEPLLKANDVIK